VTTKVQVDIAVLGSGIAGLWITESLRLKGYSVVVIEAASVGGIQTIASQGIIHGGTKYALSGSLSEAAKAIGDMPQLWRSCLAGNGPINLSDVDIRSEHQFLWSTENLISQLTGFFAGKAMRSRIKAVAPESRPVPFNTTRFKGNLYQLDELVLDMPSLIKSLAKRLMQQTITASPARIKLTPEAPHTVSIQLDSGILKIDCQHIILAAGAGNQQLLSELNKNSPAMQLRPLHMVMLKGKLPALYAHCLGANANPRLTITSAEFQQQRVWYMGGQLAESGVNISAKDQIRHAQDELQATMPWIDTTESEWGTFAVSRAEPKMTNTRRPDSYFFEQDAEITTVWPTKLAFAPRLAMDVINQLDQKNIRPKAAQPDLSIYSQEIRRAQSPWEQVNQWR